MTADNWLIHIIYTHIIVQCSSAVHIYCYADIASKSNWPLYNDLWFLNTFPVRLTAFLFVYSIKTKFLIIWLWSLKFNTPQMLTFFARLPYSWIIYVCMLCMNLINESTEILQRQTTVAFQWTLTSSKFHLKFGNVCFFLTLNYERNSLEYFILLHKQWQ